MKIKTKKASYEEAVASLKNWHKLPKNPNYLLRKIMQFGSKSELKKTNFKANYIHMDRLKKDEPCLILMNHSSFIDLKIVASVFSDRPYNIVCTSDGFVGKEWLMRNLGCIPTNKFVTDINLVKDMKYALHTLHNSVLLYPEASYSFDGTATPLPDSIGKCIKMLKVPVVMIRTYGAFQRDPLYNNLQIRNVDVSADVEYLFSPEDIGKKSVEQINTQLSKAFSFDNFKWQQEQHIKVTEPFRADYLHRVLYKCPCCNNEEKMEGKGIHITCHNCGVIYELTEEGFLEAKNGKTIYKNIPDWYKWERECVAKEIESETYLFSCEVNIGMLVNLDTIYMVGDGVLTHSRDGFELNGCDGKLHYVQSPSESYSLYADYYWYEIGDVICIGNSKVLYYCFPKGEKEAVAKARLATEEIYKKVLRKPLLKCSNA